MISILLVVAFFAVISNSNSNKHVYICMGGHSAKYHTFKYCKGLSKCRGGIKEVTINEAEKTYNRTPCKICQKMQHNLEI